MHRRPAFTLIELLVVLAILGLLVSILVPAVGWARVRARRAVCGSNLHQIGLTIQMCVDSNKGRYPVARYMPAPFLSIFTDDPGLPAALAGQLPPDSRVYRCPGDLNVYGACGISYVYNTRMSGRLDDGPARRFTLFTREETAVAYDCDGGTFYLEEGEITAPFFHAERNVLFRDAHVGKYDVPPS